MNGSKMHPVLGNNMADLHLGKRTMVLQRLPGFMVENIMRLTVYSLRKRLTDNKLNDTVIFLSLCREKVVQEAHCADINA